MIELDFFNLTNFDRQAPQKCLTDALEKFRRGARITDSELAMLIKFYQALEGLCSAMGPSFQLQRRHAELELAALERFMENRKRR